MALKQSFEAFMVFFALGGLIALPLAVLAVCSGVLCYVAKVRGWPRLRGPLSVMWKVCFGIYALWLALTFLWLLVLLVSAVRGM